MVFNDLERYRTKKIVEQFVELHRPPVSIRSQVDITYAIAGQTVELIEIRPSLGNKYTFAKIVYVRTKDVWMVYRTDSRTNWKPYDVALTLDAALQMIGTDSRECFFG
ncbi:DUF3024 domain-containing protein [Erwinia billingiae]|uniref:DUF3024 domain-containing protein n=1 Tax=Erwinia billingiae TaxID=182337 RepID=UPI00320A9827